MDETTEYLKGLKKRSENYKPVWNNVNSIIRDDFRDQLENSKGPDGKPYKKLKEATIKRGKRRSDKPYDTSEHKTWDELVDKSGGTVTKSRNDFEIKINTEGSKYAVRERPIGISDKAADKIAEEIADYLVED